MKIIDKFKCLFLPSALILHISLVLVRGYFLYPEFTLYPYLISRGFAPYRDLVDQHFPTLFFGPFSLPSFLTTNPWPLLGLFFVILCFTDIVLYYSLRRFEVKNSLVWLIFFIVCSTYFSGNVLWIETFVNPLLAIYFYLSPSKKFLPRFISGLLLSQVLLLRPTSVLGLLFLVVGLSGFSAQFILGGFVGLVIPALYLVRQGIWSDFYSIAILFNRNVYVQQASMFPGVKEVVLLLFWLLSPITEFIKKKKYLFLLFIPLFGVLAFPRFGYEHLQPLFLITTFFLAITVKKPYFVVHILILIFFVLNIISALRHSYGNYFISPEIVSLSERMKALPGQEVYLLSTPDIAYQLSGKMPPYYTYVPSLPWYLNQPFLEAKVITALELSRSPILMSKRARIVDVGGKKIFEYIKMNYTMTEDVGIYQLYLRNK